MIKIAFVRLDSGRHDPLRFEQDRREFLAPLCQEFELLEVPAGEKIAADLQVVFIASGGCEQKFIRLYHGLDDPVILLADGKHNSLAAALEISSWVRQQGGRAEIVHGDSGFIAARLRRLEIYQRTRRALAGRIGVIGEPSDWLVASAVDRDAVKNRWGSELLDIDLREVTSAPAQDGQALALANEFTERTAALDGVDEGAVLAAARLVPALKAVFRSHRLQAATLRCFSLIEQMQTSGCLALSRLNDEAMVCGCEGDVPAAFSMLLLFTLTGEIPFMANPAAVDVERNRLLLAHCSVPRRSVSGYRLQTHFETGLGVALCGDFAAGPATIFKVGDPALDRYFVSAAEVLPGRPEPGLCRTQVLLQLREPAGYFLKRPLANHHVLIKGDHAQLIENFMQFCGAQRV